MKILIAVISLVIGIGIGFMMPSPPKLSGASAPDAVVVDKAYFLDYFGGQIAVCGQHEGKTECLDLETKGVIWKDN